MIMSIIRPPRTGFVGMTGGFATCPITQGSLMRLLIREGQSAQEIVGHRQVTDAYLAQLARAHGSRLATFDQALAKLDHDVAELVPDSSGRLDGRQSPTRAPATAATCAEPPARVRALVGEAYIWRPEGSSTARPSRPVLASSWLVAATAIPAEDFTREPRYSLSRIPPGSLWAGFSLCTVPRRTVDEIGSGRRQKSRYQGRFPSLADNRNLKLFSQLNEL